MAGGFVCILMLGICDFRHKILPELPIYDSRIMGGFYAELNNYLPHHYGKRR